MSTKITFLAHQIVSQKDKVPYALKMENLNDLDEKGGQDLLHKIIEFTNEKFQVYVRGHYYHIQYTNYSLLIIDHLEKPEMNKINKNSLTVFEELWREFSVFYYENISKDDLYLAMPLNKELIEKVYNFCETQKQSDNFKKEFHGQLELKNNHLL